MVNRETLRETLSWAKKEGDKAFMLFLFIISLYLNVTLGWEVHHLRSEVNKVPRINELNVGAALPNIKAKDLNGDVQSINYADDRRPTVFYVFTPTCGWCERNAANVRALVSKRGATYRFIGISLSISDVKQYLRDHQIDFPVYTGLAAEDKRSLGLGGTPQTIVVSTSGRVMKNWTGAYTHDLQREIEGFFGVRLPGLTDDKASGSVVSANTHTGATSTDRGKPLSIAKCSRGGLEYSLGAVVGEGEKRMRCICTQIDWKSYPPL